MMHVVAPAPREQWRGVVEHDQWSLPEHAPEWIEAMCRGGRFEDASRLYEFSDGRRFILPMTRRRGVSGVGGWYGSYPPAWGIGGLAGDGLDQSVIRAVLEDLRSLRAASIVIRPNPLQASAWAAIDRPGVVTIPRQAHVLDLRGGVEAVQSRLPRAMRRGIRTAVKRGVRVELDHDGRLLPIYDQLYRISMARWAQRQREPLALARLRASLRDPREKLHHMSKCMAGAFRLYVAFVDDEPAAASIMLIGRTAHYTRGAMDREVASRARANELLHWEMIQAACAAGCATYHMGETGQSSTLAEFKERVGGRPVDYAEYRIERLPLTRFDQMLRSGVKRAIGFQDNPKPCMETSHARRS